MGCTHEIEFRRTRNLQPRIALGNTSEASVRISPEKIRQRECRTDRYEPVRRNYFAAKTILQSLRGNRARARHRRVASSESSPRFASWYLSVDAHQLPIYFKGVDGKL